MYCSFLVSWLIFWIRMYLNILEAIYILITLSCVAFYPDMLSPTELHSSKVTTTDRATDNRNTLASSAAVSESISMLKWKSTTKRHKNGDASCDICNASHLDQFWRILANSLFHSRSIITIKITTRFLPIIGSQKLENGSNACIMMVLKTFQLSVSLSALLRSSREGRRRPTSKFNFPTDLCSCQATQSHDEDR